MIILKMDFFLIFLLAHLTGDFVLQTNKIAREKGVGLKGVYIHSGIVTVTQVLFLCIFGIKGVVCGIISGILHFLVDFLKLRVNRYFNKFEFAYFIFDQAVHILIIYLLAVLVYPGISPINIYTEYSIIAIILITQGFICTVAGVMLVRDIKPALKKEQFFKKYERQIDGLTAVLLWLVWSLPDMAAIAAVIIAFTVYILLQKKMFNYKICIPTIKYMFFLAAGFLISCSGGSIPFAMF